MNELDAHEESVQGVAFDRSAESLVTVGSGRFICFIHVGRAIDTNINTFIEGTVRIFQ